MRVPYNAFWLAVVTALCGCGGPDVVRKVTLMPEAELPSGHTVVAGTTLRLSTDGLEPLASTSRYVAWASTPTVQVALGELMPGEELAVTLGSATPLEDIDAILVSEEDARQDLPPAPSPRVRMRGGLGEALDYVPVSADSLAAAHCAATIEDDALSADAHGLPVLGAGLRYAVWATVPGSMKDNPGMAGMGGGEEEAAEKPMVFIGKLDEEGALEASFPSLATATLLAITVESDRGAPSMSPARCLHGEVLLPAAQEQTTVHSH